MKPTIAYKEVNNFLIWINMLMAAIYISWWFNLSHVGDPVLYGLLFFGEIFHVATAVLFWYTIKPGKQKEFAPAITLKEFTPSVDIYITVAGEPVDIVRRTVLHANKLDYPNFKVHILNDGYVAKKDNWQEIEQLAKELNIGCITRKTPGGAKAGNLNNALRQTEGEIVVIFDADMAPHPEFLQKMIPYFADPKTGFVQSPQYYNNHHTNSITGAAWEQQEVFFGPILRGKDKSNAVFICGTNVAIRKTALLGVGGMCEDNIAEDFLTSLFIHQKGWKSFYVPEVLAEGFAPEDMLSYYKQQLRWARGSLEVVFSHNPLFKRGLTWKQKAEYLSSGLYYCSGVIIAIDALMPILALVFDLQPVSATTIDFAFYFLPFLFLNLYTLHKVTNGNVTFRSTAFSMSSWIIQLQALKSLLLKQKMTFAVTSKSAIEGNFISLAYPHILYSIAIIGAAAVGINREGLSPSVATNITWGLFNIIMFTPFIAAAGNWRWLTNWIPGAKQKRVLGDA